MALTLRLVMMDMGRVQADVPVPFIYYFLSLSEYGDSDGSMYVCIKKAGGWKGHGDDLVTTLIEM